MSTPTATKKLVITQAGELFEYVGMSRDNRITVFVTDETGTTRGLKLLSHTDSASAVIVEEH